MLLFKIVRNILEVDIFLHKFVEVITRRITPINNIIPDDF